MGRRGGSQHHWRRGRRCDSGRHSSWWGRWVGCRLRGRILYDARSRRPRHVDDLAFRAARRVSATCSRRLGTQGAQHVGRVGTLATAQLEVAVRLARCEQGVEQVQFGCAINQPNAKLGEDRKIEARIGQLQPEGVLPVDPGPYRFGRLPIGEALGRLPRTANSERRLASS